MQPLKDVQKMMMCCLDGSSTTQAPSFLSQKKKSATPPLEIYRQSVLGNHLSAFAEIYPVISQLVGESFFEHVFGQYFNSNQHQSYDVSDYGEHFGDFLDGFKACDPLPYLPDVARLEWFCHKACLGPSYLVDSFEALTLMDEQTLQRVCFKMPPSSFLIESSYPILEIYEINQLDKSDVAPIDISQKGGCQLFVWRSGLDLRIDLLSKLEYFYLDCCQKGWTLEDTIQALILQHGVSDSMSQNILSKCMQKGWLVGFTVLE